MNETTFNITAPDGKNIFCSLAKAGSPKLVVMSHGLTGGPFERMHFAARDYFTAHGYDVLRFAYYTNEAGCRALHDSTLETHAMDLNAVLDHLRRDYDEIYVCGHSYGGLTLLFAQPDATALSFWDSAYKPGWPASCEIMDGKPYVTFSGKRTLIGKAMFDEAQRLLQAPDELRSMAEALQPPSQIVVAGLNDKAETLDAMYNHMRCRKERHTIDGADHNFYAGNTLQQLLDITHAWFRQNSAAHSQRKAS